MANLFVPFNGSKLASLSINGHRLLILSHDREGLESGLALVGADNLQELDLGNSEEDQERALYELAQRAEGGVVIAPGDVHMEEIIKNLETQLPWVH